MRQPALRFKLLGAAASTVDDSPLWMGTEEYSKLTHDLRKEEKEAAAKAAEEAKVAASGVKEVAAGAGEEVDAPASNIRTAGIYNHFHDPVILSTETKPHPTKPGKTIDIHHYQCTCKVIVPVKEGGDGKTECGHTNNPLSPFDTLARLFFVNPFIPLSHALLLKFDFDFNSESSIF